MSLENSKRPEDIQLPLLPEDNFKAKAPNLCKQRAQVTGAPPKLPATRHALKLIPLGLRKF
jgi:hypothetical protein